jgi:aspartate kinase
MKPSKTPENNLVFKFGGASVKDAAGIKNVADILKSYAGSSVLVVISAMGKTTNALEEVARNFFSGNPDAAGKLKEIKNFHVQTAKALLDQRSDALLAELNTLFGELEWNLESKPRYSFNKEYDQIVSRGELASSLILYHYLIAEGFPCNLVDARDFIVTDDNWRNATVDFEATELRIAEGIKKEWEKNRILITQGFIGSEMENFTTTLGREGSDYTAAIFGYALNAASVTIWKDVPGVLNADPKWFDGTVLISQMSYQDAIELSYFGATVIHPKTLKPLQNKKIPLFVKSFLDPKAAGTVISDQQAPLPTPCFIFKVNQVLLSISPKDFSFIVEKNLGSIFSMFSDSGVTINTMQNSALSFSVCVDGDPEKLKPLISRLKEEYRVLYNEGLELVTIRYYNQETTDRVTEGKEILLEVRSRYTLQMVMKNV